MVPVAMAAAFAAGMQHADSWVAPSVGLTDSPWLNTGVSDPYTGMLPRIWKVSQAMPVGSVTQYLFPFA